MREPGRLMEWNDERGFGFITPRLGGRRAFVHVTTFPRGQRPTLGCEVTYVEITDERGRPQASAVQYVGPQPKQRSGTRGLPLAVTVVLLFFAALAGLVMSGRIPDLLVGAYLVLSLIALLMYRADKAAALEGLWRTSEASLHSVALLGGWPGALVARHAYRHKTSKEPFRTLFWATVMVNCSALGWWALIRPLLQP